MIIIILILIYIIFGGILTWGHFNVKNIANRPLYTMQKFTIKNIIFAIIISPYNFTEEQIYKWKNRKNN